VFTARYGLDRYIHFRFIWVYKCLISWRRVILQIATEMSPASICRMGRSTAPRMQTIASREILVHSNILKCHLTTLYINMPVTVDWTHTNFFFYFDSSTAASAFHRKRCSDWIALACTGIWTQLHAKRSCIRLVLRPISEWRHVSRCF
jgi:hypothetical protein